jgi:hypothetical protein
MRKFSCIMLAFVLSICMSNVALADWIPDDGHKMHYPQLPDLTGWNVNATNPVILADDWMCSASGPVTDVHFWGSWMGGMEGQIISFNLSIHADIPADPPVQPYSKPGVTLWEYEIPFEWVIAQPFTTDLDEGWYNPADGFFNYPDHNTYFQYNVFLDQYLDPADLFVQEEGTIYWLNISATVADPAITQWGWKSTQDHWNDDAVWAFWGDLNWIDMYEPPDFIQSLDLAFVITGPEEMGACCYPDPTNGFLSLCVQTTQNDCINNLLGVWEGPGTTCLGVEACCLQDGSCVDADALCCVNELGGNPMGPGTACGAFEACCFPDGSCGDLDPLCCADQGGTPQGPGTMCTGPMACCLNDGSCIMVDPECCDDLGGFVSPWSPTCLGDNDGDGTDDACQEPEEFGACCYDDAAGFNSICIVTTQDSCVNFYGGSYQGDGSQCGTVQACCLQDGTCINADEFCCVNELGGTPQGAGTACTALEACCLPDGSCQDLDPLCCIDLGGQPQGPGSQCTAAQACCMQDGSCSDLDPLCCEEMGGTPQGTGTSCTSAQACCLPDGSCQMVDPLCCDDLGGTPSSFSSTCLGDINGNGVDDACEEPNGACCYDDGTCTVETAADCANLAGDYKGDGTTCLGDSDGDGNDDICDDPWPNHKMHYPQPPDETGWDVEATMYPLADDWQCSETGFVKDIHFWGSWRDGIEVPIDYFIVGIYSDIPADPPQIPYSQPGNLLWSMDVFEYEVVQYAEAPLEGWYDPSQELVLPDNHDTYYRYDIYLDEQNWFPQEAGTIYWLSIQAVLVDPGVTTWGWKSSYEHWNDDAVWMDMAGTGWMEMYEPPDPIVNAFGVIMGPANNLIDGFGENAYGEGWYRYPTDWWNIWFYDHPFTYDRFKDIHLFVDFVPTAPDASVVLAINWSTDLWSLEGNPPGPRRPPLPGDEPELDYIGRHIVYQGEVMPGPMEFDYTIPDYNPEWVSVDIMGQNFDIPGGVIEHDCRSSLDLAFVITNGPPCSGKCGDANGDGTVNVSDAVWIINYVFIGGAAPIPLACGDANSDCTVNVSDAVWIINYVFIGGAQPGDCCPGGPGWIDGDCCPFTP